MAYNTKVSHATGVTPYLALFGRECRLPVDLIIPSPEDLSTVADHVRHAVTNFTTIYAYMRKNQDAVIRRNAKLYTGSTHDFKIGDNVWYLCPRKVGSKPQKITDTWVGPYTIQAKPAQVLLRIKPLNYEGPTITVHISRLVPCRSPTAKQRLPGNLQIDQEADEAGEEIRPPQLSELPAFLANTAVPVQCPVPESIIVDIPRPSAPIKEQADKAVTTQSGALVTESPTGRADINMDTHGQPGSSKRPRESESEYDTRQARLRPRRSKEKALAEFEARRKAQTQAKDHDTWDELVTETSQAETHSRSRSPLQQNRWKDLVPGASSEDAGHRSRSPIVRPPDSNDATKYGPAKPEDLPKANNWRELVMESADESSAVLGDHNDNPIVDILAGSNKPRRSTPGSAGYDLQAARTVTIHGQATARIPLNVRMALPTDLCALLVSRSGLAVKGITTQAGLIDSDYRGEISAVIHNSTNQSFTVKKGQRITQALFLKASSINFNEVRELMEPDSNHSGFGSTDNDPRVCIPPEL